LCLNSDYSSPLPIIKDNHNIQVKFLSLFILLSVLLYCVLYYKCIKRHYYTPSMQLCYTILLNTIVRSGVKRIFGTKLNCFQECTYCATQYVIFLSHSTFTQIQNNLHVRWPFQNPKLSGKFLYTPIFQMKQEKIFIWYLGTYGNSNIFINFSPTNFLTRNLPSTENRDLWKWFIAEIINLYFTYVLKWNIFFKKTA
jgi:hypothetical protein